MDTPLLLPAREAFWTLCDILSTELGGFLLDLDAPFFSDLPQGYSPVGNTTQIRFRVHCLLNLNSMHFLNCLGVLFKIKYVSIFYFEY